MPIDKKEKGYIKRLTHIDYRCYDEPDIHGILLPPDQSHQSGCRLVFVYEDRRETCVLLPFVQEGYPAFGMHLLECTKGE